MFSLKESYSNTKCQGVTNHFGGPSQLGCDFACCECQEPRRHANTSQTHEQLIKTNVRLNSYIHNSNGKFVGNMSGI